MKKGVALLISLVALVAVMVVAFFGVYAANIYPRIYITSIEIRDMYGNKIEENAYGYKQLTLTFNPDLEDDDGTKYMQYYFTTVLNEDGEEPTRSSFLYVIDTSQDIVTFATEGAQSKGAFLIKESSSTFVRSVTCVSNDGGPAVSDQIYLVILYS